MPIAPLQHVHGPAAQSPIIASTTPTGSSHAENNYRGISHAFKGQSSKYGGELDQNWSDALQQY